MEPTIDEVIIDAFLSMFHHVRNISERRIKDIENFLKNNDVSDETKKLLETISTSFDAIVHDVHD